MSAIIVLGQMVVLFSMIVAGFIACRSGSLSETTSGQLSKLVVNLFNPLLIVNSVLTPTQEVTGEKMLTNVLLVCIYFVIVFICGLAAVLLLRPVVHQRGLYLMMMIFSNVGFMGIPVVQSIYGKTAVVYVAVYVLGYNALLYSLGSILAERSAAKFRGQELSGQGSVWQSVKKMLNPGVIASLAAILILLLKIQVPDFVGTFFDYMGNVTIPLSMMLIGASVARMDVKDILGDVRMYLFLLMKMLLFPLLVLLIFRSLLNFWNLSVDPVLFGIFILEMGMPVGNVTALIAQEKGADPKFCSKGIVLSTLVSILTIPLLCLFL